MTEPVDVLILNALMTQISTPALSGSPPIASPLVAYAPTPGTKYLDCRDPLRAEPDHAGLAAADSTQHRGIFQIDVVVPDGQGAAPGLRLAALVAARFAIGTKVAAGSRYLKFDKVPTIAAAVKDAPWVRFPVSIPYQIFN